MHCAISTLLLALCFQHCAISTVLLALSNQHCANRTMLSALCYYAVLAKLGLIQGNSRCFGANCKMSQNTRFLCYYFGLKYSSVLFFTLIPSLIEGAAVAKECTSFSLQINFAMHYIRHSVLQCSLQHCRTLGEVMYSCALNAQGEISSDLYRRQNGLPKSN